MPKTLTNQYGETIPNLFVVGSPKCGTSSLYYWLSQHPEIFMSSPKEPMYFCQDFHKNNPKYFNFKNLDDYLEIFKNTAKEKIIGEASTNYIYSKVAPEKIYSFNPKAKIIIIIRKPTEFIASFHSHKVRRGTEKNKQIEEAVKNDPDYLEKTRFSKYIKNFQNVFPSEQIKIILFDDIKNRPLSLYKETLQFLNIEDINFSPILEQKNPHREIKIKFVHTHILRSEKWGTLKRPFQKILPQKIRKKIYFFLKNKNEKIKPREQMNKDLELYIKNKTKSEMEILNQMSDKNILTLWGYNK